MREEKGARTIADTGLLYSIESTYREMPIERRMLRAVKEGSRYSIPDDSPDSVRPYLGDSLI